MKILVTGFEPFNKKNINASSEVLKLLDNDFEKIILPVVYNKCFDVLKDKILSFNPDVVICMGEAQKRKNIEVEKIAINYMNGSIADNEGNIFKNMKIVNDGPDGIFSNLNFDDIEKENISLSAGGYVCNNLFYNLMFYIKNNNKIKGGFIHVPSLSDYKDVAKKCNLIIKKLIK